MTAARTEPWRLWLLLSVTRGTLGREIRYGWETIAEVRLHADVKLPALNLQAEHRATGERWQRVRGTWRQAPTPRDVAGSVAEIDLEADRGAPRAEQRPRYYWEDRE